MKILSAPVIVTAIAIVCIGLAVAYNGEKIDQLQAARKPTTIKASIPTVSVIQALTNTYQAYVSSHGETKAHWDLTLKSEVEGEVTTINAPFETGSMVTKDSVLANIDNTDYFRHKLSSVICHYSPH